MLIERGSQSMEPNNFDLLLDIIEKSTQNLLFEGATDQEIEELEKTLDKKLPPSYRKFLKITNGAYLYQGEEMLGTKDGEDGFQISILTAKQELEDLPEHLIPFNSSNTYYCFDTTQPNQDKVKYQGEYKIARWYMDEKKIETVSGSFPQWFNEYIILENEHINIKNDQHLV